MRPGATYRIQLTRHFTLADARRLVDYLDDLGVTHVYLSPIFSARPGSTHGYDVVDPTRVSDVLGGRSALVRLARALRRRGMGILLDVVPNHMAVSEETRWLRDVLDRGPRSRFAHYFDIDWEAGKGKIILPTLGEPGPDRVEGAAVRVYWKTGAARLNYRRFFNINHLIGVRVEEEDVFEATHALVLRLVENGVVDGLRIDHVDGLRDPAGYLRRLRGRVGPRAYVVVEKILARGERLPRWPVDGTTGYDFLAAVGGVFVDPAGLAHLARLHGGPDFETTARRARHEVLRRYFAGAVDRMVRRRWRPAERAAVRRALVEVTACMPVYRTYARTVHLRPADRRVIARTLRSAAPRRGGRELARALHMTDRAPRERRADLQFVERWQQLTGAIAAKGVEDTAFYRYNRLVSLNEVGGDAGPTSVPEFHRLAARRGASMNATATHDTKRGEDTRARIHVISEIATEWGAFVRRWIHLAPDPGLGHLFFQTLAGAWPLEDTGPGRRAFHKRVERAMIKSAREAKRGTSWIERDDAFERRVRDMVARAFEARFLDDFLPIQRRIAFHGAVNGLAQLVLKLCAPGVPDIYQGDELWDLDLVDPDNRRRVDFDRRRRALAAIGAAGPRELLETWEDGRVKLAVTRAALRLRRDRPGLVAEGEYIPVPATGRGRRHVVAFARRRGSEWMIAVVPRLTVGLVPAGVFPVGGVWKRAGLLLHRHAPTRWREALTGRELAGPLLLRDVLGEMPVAILVSAARRASRRGA